MTALSPRERECVELLSDGKSDADIALLLDITPRTVRFHVHNAKSHLGARTRCHLVKLAVIAAQAEREVNRLRNAEEMPS